jgi:hypothetical protein
MSIHYCPVCHMPTACTGNDLPPSPSCMCGGVTALKDDHIRLNKLLDQEMVTTAMLREELAAQASRGGDLARRLGEAIAERDGACARYKIAEENGKAALEMAKERDALSARVKADTEVINLLQQDQISLRNDRDALRAQIAAATSPAGVDWPAFAGTLSGQIAAATEPDAIERAMAAYDAARWDRTPRERLKAAITAALEVKP